MFLQEAKECECSLEVVLCYCLSRKHKKTSQGLLKVETHRQMYPCRNYKFVVCLFCDRGQH